MRLCMANHTAPRNRPKLIAILVAAIVVIGGLIWLAFALGQDEQTIPQAQLPDNTEVGAVELRVHDLAVMRNYYVDAVGLEVLELYVDTDPESWKWVEGEVQMGSAPLDPRAFIQAHLGDATSDATMGHVHLKVGDLEQAEAFYADMLGFAVTSRGDGALFYAVGGYLHHLATNTWMSAGADVRENGTGLGSLTIAIPDDGERDALIERFEAANHEHAVEGEVITTKDPWGNEVRIVPQR